MDYTIEESFSLNISSKANSIYDICLTKEGFYGAECLYRNICTNLNQQFIKTGVIIIITYILIMWGLYFLNHYWYHRFDYFKEEHNLIYWNDWIKTRFLNLFLIYTAMYLFFNLNIDNLDIIITKYKFILITIIIIVILVRLYLVYYETQKGRD